MPSTPGNPRRPTPAAVSTTRATPGSATRRHDQDSSSSETNSSGDDLPYSAFGIYSRDGRALTYQQSTSRFSRPALDKRSSINQLAMVWGTAAEDNRSVGERASPTSMRPETKRTRRHTRPAPRPMTKAVSKPKPAVDTSSYDDSDHDRDAPSVTKAPIPNEIGHPPAMLAEPAQHYSSSSSSSSSSDSGSNGKHAEGPVMKPVPTKPAPSRRPLSSRSAGGNKSNSPGRHHPMNAVLRQSLHTRPAMPKSLPTRRPTYSLDSTSGSDSAGRLHGLDTQPPSYNLETTSESESDSSDSSRYGRPLAAVPVLRPPRVKSTAFKVKSARRTSYGLGVTSYSDADNTSGTSDGNRRVPSPHLAPPISPVTASFAGPATNSDDNRDSGIRCDPEVNNCRPVTPYSSKGPIVQPSLTPQSPLYAASMADDPVDGEADSSVDRPIPKSNPVGPLSIPVLNANPTDSFPAQPMVVDASSRDSDNKAKPPSAIAPGRPYLPSPILAPTPPPIKAPGSAVTKALAVAESSSESDSDSESDGSAVMTSSNVLPVVIATPRPAPKAATRPHASWPTTQVTTNGSPSPSDSSDEDDQPTTTPRPAFMPSIVHHFTSLISRFSSSPSASTATDIGIGHPEAKHAADPGPSKTPNRKVTAARSIVKPPMMYSSPHTGLSGPVGSSSDEDSSDNSDGSPKRWCAPTATSQSVKATEVKPCANIAGKGKGGELAGATADGSATKDSPAVPSVATPSPLQTSEIPVTLPPPSQPSTHTSDVPSSASGHGTLQKVEATEARPVNFSAYDPSRPSAVLPISNIETIEDASHHETKLAVPATDIAPTPALLPMAAGLAPAPRNTAVDDAEYSSYSDDSDSDSDSDNQERDVTVAPTPPEPLPIPETRVGSPTAEPELTMKPSDRDSESDGPVPVKLAAAVALPASQLATRSLSGISTDSSDEEDEDSQLTKTPGTTHARSPYSFKYTSLQSIPSMSKLTATENGSHRDSDGSDQGSRRATQSNVPGNPKPQPPTRRTPIVKPPVMTPGLQPAAQSCSNTSSDDDTSSSDDDDNNGSRLFNRRVAPAIAYRNRPGLVPTPTPAARVALRDSSPSSINPTASISDDDQDSDSEASDILSTKVQTQASELTSLTPTHALEPGLANEESRSTLRPVVSTFDVDDKTSTLQPPILETRTPSNDASHAETDTTNHIPRNMTPEIPSTIPGAVADVSSASDSASSTGSNTDSDDTDNERQNSQAKAATATTAPPTPPPNTDSASAGPPAGRDVTETTASPRPTEALKPGSGAQLGSGEHTPDYPGDRTETTTITTPSSGPLAPVDPPANPEITKATVEPQIGKATEPISDYSSDPDSDSDGGDTGSQRGQVDSSTMPGPTPMTAGVVTSLSACEASASESTDEGDMNARTEAPPNPPQNPESTRLPAAATVSDSSSDSSSNSEGEQPTPTVAAAPLPLLQTPAPKPAQTVTPRLAKRPASDSDSNDSDSDVNHPPSKRLKSHEPSRVQARLNSRNPVIKRPIRMSKRPAPDTSSDESDSDGDDGPGKSGPTALPNPATGAVPHHGPTGAPRAAPKSHFLSLSAISRAGTFAGLRDNAFLVSGAAKVLVDPKFGSTTADTDRSDVTAAAAAGNHHPAMRRSVSGGGRTGPANRLARFSMGPVPNRAHQKGDDDESDSEPSSESNSDSDSSGDDDDGKKAGSSGTSSRPPLSTGLNFIPRPKSAQIPGMSGGKAAPVIKMARGPVAKSVKDKSRRRTMF